MFYFYLKKLMFFNSILIYKKIRIWTYYFRTTLPLKLFNITDLCIKNINSAFAYETQHDRIYLI